ncbi:hypothetical protein Hanom_Chr09g00871981 [Helianthus anomalus]
MQIESPITNPYCLHLHYRSEMSDKHQTRKSPKHTTLKTLKTRKNFITEVDNIKWTETFTIFPYIDRSSLCIAYHFV